MASQYGARHRRRFGVLWACCAVPHQQRAVRRQHRNSSIGRTASSGAITKHPPMPTWMLGSMQRMFGLSRWTAIVLAALCFIVTGCCVGHRPDMLLGRRAATAVILLWGLQQSFSTRHNILQPQHRAPCSSPPLPCGAALRSRNGNAYWVLTGLFGGAAAAVEVPRRSSRCSG